MVSNWMEMEVLGSRLCRALSVAGTVYVHGPVIRDKWDLFNVIAPARVIDISTNTGAGGGGQMVSGKTAIQKAQLQLPAFRARCRAHVVSFSYIPTYPYPKVHLQISHGAEIIVISSRHRPQPEHTTSETSVDQSRSGSSSSLPRLEQAPFARQSPSSSTRHPRAWDSSTAVERTDHAEPITACQAIDPLF